jgi:hypothetical protein
MLLKMYQELSVLKGLGSPEREVGKGEICSYFQKKYSIPVHIGIPEAT